jgi:SpoVK/Ycf46/Vps4 family AAA+-type ATPase
MLSRSLIFKNLFCKTQNNFHRKNNHYDNNFNKIENDFNQLQLFENHNKKNNNNNNNHHSALKILTPNKNPYVVNTELNEHINNILFMTNPKIKNVIKHYEKIVNLNDINTKNYILLYGPPGCGKTHLASHLAIKTNKQLVALNFSKIKSQWVGEEPKSLNKCLTDIDSHFNDSIIIADEIDTMLCQRKYDSVSARDGTASVNILLSWMDGVNTTNDNRLIIFTTNNKKELDRAFLDRITYKINIKHLSPEQMYGYWKSHLNYLSNEEIIELSKLHFNSFRSANNVLKNAVMEKIKTKKYNSYIYVEDINTEYKKLINTEKTQNDLQKYLI